MYIDDDVLVNAELCENGLVEHDFEGIIINFKKINGEDFAVVQDQDFDCFDVAVKSLTEII